MAAWKFGRKSSTAKGKKAAPAHKGEPQAKRSAGVQGEITQEMIAKRAHEIWEKKGRPNDQSEQNWLEAEAELRAEFKATH